MLLFLTPDAKLEQQVFLQQWKGTAQEHRVEVSGIPPASEVVESVCPKLEAGLVFFIARRKQPDADMVYFSCKSFNGIFMLVELGFRPGSGVASITIKSPQPQYVPLLADALGNLLKSP